MTENISKALTKCFNESIDKRYCGHIKTIMETKKSEDCDGFVDKCFRLVVVYPNGKIKDIMPKLKQTIPDTKEAAKKFEIYALSEIFNGLLDGYIKEEIYGTLE